jgi:hypothetical protein
MFLGRIARLIIFGIVVSISTATGYLIGYQPAVIFVGLLLAAVISGLLLVRYIRRNSRSTDRES